MPNRFQSKQYNAIAAFLDERDGHYCLACYIETGQRRGTRTKLEIDHTDSDRRNWSPDNLHWLCKTHNIKFRSLSVKEHISIVVRYSAENVRGRVRDNLYLTETKRKVSYLLGSPEMQVNSIAENHWLDWMHNMINANGSISKEDAVFAGAIEADDVNPQTTERYWKKHTSISGRFQEIKKDGQKYAIYREYDKTAAVKHLKKGKNGSN